MRARALIVAALSTAALGAAAASANAGAGRVAGTSVVGGHPPAAGRWRFAVAVRTPTELCSGSVISATRVLTAAHCIDAPGRMSVRAGSGRAGSGGELLGVQAVVVHPAFSANLPGNALVNDLAVLKLAAPTSAPPVALASDAEDAALSAPGAPLISAGFGRRNPSALGRPRQGVLRAVRLRSRKACAHYPAFSAVTMLCASGSRFAAPIPGRGLKPVARSGCFGDSGGPLIAATPAGPRLLGVLSYGPVYPDRFETVACGLKGFPDVYTRVASGRAFIEANS